MVPTVELNHPANSVCLSSSAERVVGKDTQLGSLPTTGLEREIGKYGRIYRAAAGVREAGSGAVRGNCGGFSVGCSVVGMCPLYTGRVSRMDYLSI